jgi:hypothetical protein
MVVDMKLYVMQASLNGLKVWDFAGEPKSEFVPQNLETFVKVYELVVTDCHNPTIYAVSTAQ